MSERDWTTPEGLAELEGLCHQYVPITSETGLQLIAALRAREQEIAELQAWRDEAVAACARRNCATRDRRIADTETENERLESERDAARAEIERLKLCCVDMRIARDERDALRKRIEDVRARGHEHVKHRAPYYEGGCYACGWEQALSDILRETEPASGGERSEHPGVAEGEVR